ncbi:peptidase M24 [Halobacteria archaeon AArc-dxtr1]|nr:peptidase M24 [Halobacteria archaeon AArc-dxtr1]
MTERATDALAAELADRDADAVVHVGRRWEPTIQHCLALVGAESTVDPDDPLASTRDTPHIHAVAFDGDRWYHRVNRPTDAAHPAEALADELVAAGREELVLVPAAVPHDAALYLEAAGIEVASTDAFAEARRVKSAPERERIERAQNAAGAGLEAVATLLTQVESAGDHDASLEAGDVLSDQDGPVTADRLRIAANRAIVAADAEPAGNTRIVGPKNGPIRAADPVVVSLAPREPGGYHGGLVRTLVPVSDGGGERRAHVALTRAFRSAQVLLTAEPATVAAVEADLEAEIRAFGFADDDEIRTRVRGVGREPEERPLAPGAEIGSETVVRVAASVTVDGTPVQLADALVPGAEGDWLTAPPRALDPGALLE